MTFTRRPGGLWRNGDFVRLWTGETVSHFGSEITTLALPLAAVLILDATPAQMGILNASTYMPFLLLTLFAGVWVDRRRRRPILILANAGRALVIGLVPLLYAMSALRMPVLYLVALLIGVLTVMFELAYQSYLPTVVAREELVEGNSKLQLSASAAQVGGPGIGGLLVQALTAPVALLIDALTFAFSVFTLRGIKAAEAEPEAPVDRRPMWGDIREGLKFTLGDPLLRPCALEAGTYNMFWMSFETVFLLFAARQLGLAAGMIGLTLACGAVGALVGAVLAERIAKRIGIGTTIVWAMVVGCAAPLLVPLTATADSLVVPILILSFFLGGAGSTLANIHVVSMRQTITPDRLLGRMNASYRFLSWGVVPVGAGLGGALGTFLGLLPTLWLSAAGVLAAAAWVVFSPVRDYRGPTAGGDEPGDPLPADEPTGV